MLHIWILFESFSAVALVRLFITTNQAVEGRWLHYQTWASFIAYLDRSFVPKP